MYDDNLDYDVGHVPAAALSMAELELVADKGRVNIRNFSLIKIESVNLKATGLPGDSHRTWLLEAGAVQDRYDDVNSTVARVRGQIGRAYPLGGFNSVIGMRAGGAIQSNYLESNYRGSSHGKDSTAR